MEHAQWETLEVSTSSPEREGLPEALFDVSALAKYLGLSIKWVRMETKAGLIPGFKIAGQWRYRRSDIDAWLETKR